MSAGVPARDRVMDSVRQASERPPLWIYVLGRDELTPPQRPVELVAKDAAGTVLARGPLGALTFVPPATGTAPGG